MQFVVVRLGKDSIAEIKHLDSLDATSSIPFSFNFTCSQVEEGISAGNYVVLWLGSDNNKGQATSWKQGVRAIGKIANLTRHGGFNDTNDIEIEVLSTVPQSIDQFDFLEKSASHYKYFSKYPVVGVRSSRNNAIQKVHEDDRQKTSALLTAISILYPEVRDQLENTSPELLDLLNFVPVGEAHTEQSTQPILADGDDAWKWVTHEIYKKNERNFLFLGTPGTGKTWYAQEIAKKLTDNDSARHAFVQFHPSFSYDDFVEGYTPRLRKGSSAVEYRLQDKHFLDLCTKAKSDGSNLYVIVIDEFSRGEPSRIFGELLTYIEVEHRNREFSLAYSGKKTFIPKNVVIIATANPYDRSVGELDDALIRRFVMRDFPPDSTLLQNRLKDIGAPDDFAARLLHVFGLINERFPNGFGHSHFWNIRNEEDFQTLWQSRVLFLLKRAFLFDDASLVDLQQEVDSVFPTLTILAEEEPVPAVPVEVENAAEQPPAPPDVQSDNGGA